MAGKGFREAKDGELLTDAFRDFTRQGKGTSEGFGEAFRAYADALLKVAQAYGEKDMTPEEREEAREALYKINARGGAEAIEGVAMARNPGYKGDPDAPAKATAVIAKYWDRRVGRGVRNEGDKGDGYATFVGKDGKPTDGATVTVHLPTVDYAPEHPSPAKPKKPRSKTTPRQAAETKFRRRFGDFGISLETFRKQLAQVPDSELEAALEYFRVHASGDEEPLAVLLRIKKGEYRQR